MVLKTISPGCRVRASLMLFFYPLAGTSQTSTAEVSDESVTGTSPVQTTEESATRPVEAPGMRRGNMISKNATQPVEATDTGPEALLTSTRSAAVHLDQSLAGGKTVTGAGVSDTEDVLQSEPGSPVDGNVQGKSTDRYICRDETAHQELSEEETIRGVRSFMGWHQIPDFDSSSSSLDDNPFASTRAQPTGQVSVKLPVDEWLCRKLEMLNLTMAEGYPSTTAVLLRDQFIKTPRTSRWYNMYMVQDYVRSKVSSWFPEQPKLNSSFSSVARHSLLSAPVSRPVYQETLRKWERSAREQTLMCNQAAGFSRCITKVQDASVAQLKTLHTDKGKGKAPERSQHAVDELEYLVTFNRSITQAMARMMQDLSPICN